MASVMLVEEGCVEVFTDLSVKLSEPQFRQFFLKLLDWATNSSAPKLRLISFYHLATKWVLAVSQSLDTHGNPCPTPPESKFSEVVYN